MIRTILLMGFLTLLAACGGNPTPPRSVEDACLLIRERPDIYRAMRASEREWGIPVHVQMAAMRQESSFRHDARTPYRWALGVIPMGRQSSALGYSQALDGTWEDYQSATRNRRANRTNIRDATDFMGWYMNRSVERLGIEPGDARNHYLAYHEGHTGFANRSYRAKPWLMEVADRVAANAQMYGMQLAQCR